MLQVIIAVVLASITILLKLRVKQKISKKSPSLLEKQIQKALLCCNF